MGPSTTLSMVLLSGVSMDDMTSAATSRRGNSLSSPTRDGASLEEVDGVAVDGELEVLATTEHAFAPRAQRVQRRERGVAQAEVAHAGTRDGALLRAAVGRPRDHQVFVARVS